MTLLVDFLISSIHLSVQFVCSFFRVESHFYLLLSNETNLTNARFAIVKEIDQLTRNFALCGTPDNELTEKITSEEVNDDASFNTSFVFLNQFFS